MNKHSSQMLNSKKIFWLTYLHSIECKISPKLLRKVIFEQSIQGGFLDSGDRDQDHSHENEMQKSKMAVWGGLTNSSEKKRSEEKRKDISIWMQSSKEYQGEIRKPSSVINAKN